MSPENYIKSDELLQAQLAAYAAEAVRKSDGDHLINGIGSIALHEQNPVTLTVEELKVVPDDDTGLVKAATVHSEKTLGDPAGYARFLRENGGRRYEPIRARTELLQAYAAFRPQVTSIQREFETHTFYTDHPQHLGRGLTSAGTLLEKDGKEYVMRSGMARALKGSEVDHYVAGMIAGRKLPHFEQLSALSYEDGVLISEKMAGSQLSKITPIELNRDATDQQLDEMVDSLQLAGERGIELDPRADNIFYDKEEGFGFIDYSRVNEDAKEGHLARHIDYGSALILASGSPDSLQTAQDYADALPFIAAEISLIERYEAACQRRLNPQQYAEAIPPVIQRRNRLIEQYNYYSNPDEVARRIVDKQRSAARRAAQPRAVDKDSYLTLDSELL